MLARTGFRDHAALAHALHQESLAHDVVRLVRPRMVQVFAFDVDARAPEVTRQVFGKGDRRGPPRIASHQFGVLAPERWIAPGSLELAFEFLERWHQNLGDERPTKLRVITSAFHASPSNVCEKTNSSVRQVSST